jgi:hypothetical protein
MPQSLGQSRVVDPILTSIAFGIKIPGYVGGLAFPPVMVPKRKAKVISFGTKEQKYLYATRRAPGGNVTRISTGYGDTEISLYQDAIEAELPVEVNEESEGVVDMQRRSAQVAKQALCHRLEFDQLSLLGNFNGYPVTNRVFLTGTSQFSDVNSPIEALFDAAKDAIVTGIGQLPNTIIYGGMRAYNALKRHPYFKNQFQRAGTRTITAQLIAEALDLPTYGISLATTIDPINPTAPEVPMFNNKIWIGYVPNKPDVPLLSGLNPSLDSDRAMPSFGYTYLRGQGAVGDSQTGILMETPYYGNNERTWYFPAVADRAPIVTGMAAGYLFDNVSA